MKTVHHRKKVEKEMLREEERGGALGGKKPEGSTQRTVSGRGKNLDIRPCKPGKEKKKVKAERERSTTQPDQVTKKAAERHLRKKEKVDFKDRGNGRMGGTHGSWKRIVERPHFIKKKEKRRCHGCIGPRVIKMKRKEKGRKEKVQDENDTMDPKGRRLQHKG